MDDVKHSPLPPEYTHRPDNHHVSAYNMHTYPTRTPVNHALQDYQMQLLLLERQNKERLIMARGVQQESSINDRTQDIQPECSSAGNHQFQMTQAQLDRSKENKKRLSKRLEEQNGRRIQAARESQEKMINGFVSPAAEKVASRHEPDKYRPRLLVLQEQYDMSMLQFKEHQQRLERTLGHVSQSMPPKPEEPLLSDLEKQVFPKEVNQHQATLEGQARGENLSNHIKKFSQDLQAPHSPTVSDYTSLRSPHDMNVFVDCSARQGYSTKALSLEDLEKLAQLERARNALLIKKVRLDADEPLKDIVISPGSPQAPDTEIKPLDANLRSPHDMNAGAIQSTLPIQPKSTELESLTREGLPATILRSPHDMNADPIQSTLPVQPKSAELESSILEEIPATNLRSPHDMNTGPIQSTLPVQPRSAEPESSTHKEIPATILRSPHDMNAGPIQSTLPVQPKSAEPESSTHEEIPATNLRSPHDMNALPDEIPSQGNAEIAGLEHQRQDLSSMRAQILQQQLHNQQVFQAYRQKQMQRMVQIREPQTPGFAPASFEYKGTPVTAFASPNDDTEASSCHLEHAPVDLPLSHQKSDRAIADPLKSENTAIMPQLKQFGSKRRMRRGQLSAVSPPRNTPICRIRNRAATAGVRSLSGSRLSSQPAQEFDDSRFNEANISCHRGVALSIRLHMEE